MLRKTILCCCLIAAGPRCAAADADVRLRFDGIGAYALDHSPHARILRRNVDLVEARRDASLTWSNPELSWELEKTGTGPLSDREYTIALAKEFTLPWAGAPHRAAWERRLEAARRGRSADTRRLVSELRFGFVALAIRDAESARLERFETLLERVSRVAGSRESEGALSGVERRLVDLSLLGVRRSILEIRDERRSLLARWKTDMGIPAGAEVTLEAGESVWGGFREVDLSGASGLDATADFARRQLLVEAAGMDVRSERGGILPAVTLSGGYRNAGDDRDGFVVGLSAPLPFLGRNTGAVNERRAAFETARLRLDLYRAGRDRRVALLVETAAGKAALLDRHAGIVEDIDVQIENLAASYIEGWLSLAGFFEGIEICAGGVADFFGLLGEFYEIVFELEALTERELVRSVSPEREGKER
ncbi:MAG: TolC family protein [Candidatus Krumholzibacteriota bacterium]|nr:TolC family protein [Candidatus Krumholzibacteriota bacterium]